MSDINESDPVYPLSEEVVPCDSDWCSNTAKHMWAAVVDPRYTLIKTRCTFLLCDVHDRMYQDEQAHTANRLY